MQHRSPRALPWAECSNWAYSPPHLCSQRSKSCIYMNVLLLKNWFVFNRRFLDIFFEIFGCARQYEQALLHSLARKLAAARHSPSKLGLCVRLAQTFFQIITEIFFIISVIFFSFCAYIFHYPQENFCYKVCNTYYKLCNMC